MTYVVLLLLFAFEQHQHARSMFAQDVTRGSFLSIFNSTTLLAKSAETQLNCCQITDSCRCLSWSNDVVISHDLTRSAAINAEDPPRTYNDCSGWSHKKQTSCRHWLNRMYCLNVWLAFPCQLNARVTMERYQLLNTQPTHMSSATITALVAIASSP